MPDKRKGAKSRSGRRKRKPPIPKKDSKDKKGTGEFQVLDDDAGIDFQTLVQKVRYISDILTQNMSTFEKIC